MKLKTKLLITFLILILAPIMFTSLAFFGISRYQMNAVKKLYGVENASYETLSNTPAMLSRITKDAYTGMQAKSESDPDAFEDTAYLDALNTAIEELRADGTLKTLSEKYFGQDISSEN